MKKILQIFLFCFIFSGFLFGQKFKDLPKNPQDVVNFKSELGFENSEDKIVSFKFFDNEQKLLLLGSKNVQVWDVSEGKMLRKVSHKIKNLDKTDIYSVISPDSRKVVVFDSFSFRLFRKPKRVTASVFDLVTGEKIAELDGDNKGIRFAGWSLNGKTLATFSELSGDEGEVEFCSWEGETLKRRFCKTIPGDLKTFILSDDGNKIFLSLNVTTKDFFGIKSKDFVNLYNAESGVFLAEFRRTVSGIGIIIVSPNSKYLVADNLWNKVSIWKLNDKNSSLKFTFGTDKSRSARFLGFNNTGNLFAVNNQNRLEIYNGDTEKRLFDVNREKLYETAVFSPDDEILIADDCDKADVFDIPTQKKLYEIKLVCKTQTSLLQTSVIDNDRISFHPESKFFLTYSDKTARIWETKTGKLLQTVINPEKIKTKQKNKNADDGLGDSAGWILQGKFLYALAADRKSILIWEVFK